MTPRLDKVIPLSFILYGTDYKVTNVCEVSLPVPSIFICSNSKDLWTSPTFSRHCAEIIPTAVVCGDETDCPLLTVEQIKDWALHSVQGKKGRTRGLLSTHCYCTAESWSHNAELLVKDKWDLEKGLFLQSIFIMLTHRSQAKQIFQTVPPKLTRTEINHSWGSNEDPEGPFTFVWCVDANAILRIMLRVNIKSAHWNNRKKLGVIQNFMACALEC